MVPVVIGPVRVAAVWKVTSWEVAEAAPAPCPVATVSGNSTTSPATATSAVPALGTIDARLLLHDMDNPLGTVPLARCAGDYTDPGSHGWVAGMTAASAAHQGLAGAAPTGDCREANRPPRFFAPQ